MAKEQQQPSVSKQNPYENSLFWIQVKYYDGKGGRGYVEEPKSPFPNVEMTDFQLIGHMTALYKAMGLDVPKYTDQELSDWLAQMNKDFNETLQRETLDKL